jgi:hypothetical protein
LQPKPSAALLQLLLALTLQPLPLVTLVAALLLLLLLLQLLQLLLRSEEVSIPLLHHLEPLLLPPMLHILAPPRRFNTQRAGPRDDTVWELDDRCVVSAPHLGVRAPPSPAAVRRTRAAAVITRQRQFCS